jgi:hypothetical protein
MLIPLIVSSTAFISKSSVIELHFAYGASPELTVFLHELAHAVDDHLYGIHGDQIPLHEVVTEFDAAVIAFIRKVQYR